MTNLFIIALPSVIAINLLLGAVVFFTHIRRLANRVFTILSIIIALWLSCQYFGSTTSSEAWLEFWIRQACVASSLMLLFFHLLQGTVARPKETFAHLLRRSWLWVATTIAIAVLCQTRFFLVGAHLSTAANALAEPTYGPGFIIFVGFWIVTVAVLVRTFYLSMAQAEGVCHKELQVMAFGSFLALVPGVLLILVTPLLTGSSQSARVTPITVVIWHSVIAYGIATRHIMGVGELLRRTITYALLIGFLSLLYALTFRLMLNLPFVLENLRQTAAHVVAAIAIALTFAPAKELLQHRANRLFDERHDDMSNLLHRGGELAQSITTVDALFHDFSHLLQTSLGLSHVRIYLRSGVQFVLHTHLGAVETVDMLDKAEPLVQSLQVERYPLLRDVLRRAGGSILRIQAEHTLTRLNAEAAVALKSNNGLIGFLLLGRRLNGRIFGRREEDALMHLGDQMGIALENATLYTRLEDARMYNEVLLDNLVTGVVAANTEGCITVCNREAQRILHLTKTEAVMGRPAKDLLPEPIWNELHTSLVSGHDMRDQDLILHPQSPDKQAVRFATAVFGGDGRVAAGVLLVIQDTSAIRKLEEQIRRSDRLASIGTLAAGMAHEIKNPLVCLKTFVQLLPSRYDDPEFRNTFTPLLGNEVDRINTIVTQLLNFSRPAKPKLAPLSLHLTLDHAWHLAIQQIKSKGLLFERHYNAGCDRLLGDNHLLGQVFLNLFLNGIDAMESGGTLTVSTHTIGQPTQLWPDGQQDTDVWIEVRIQDTGSGIEPDNWQRIFDPFFTTKANGTGLGLSVAHGIILEHQGVIDVVSSPGKGTCFCVLLPLLDASGENNNQEQKGEA
ncbi:MAG: ATP-binding protein [Kiritimatiellae bacterium]|jgi:two-component system nitrogen regulation sensor histidine kinase GlnL|nr:ATP-binding protein [Kiritimatiellia bacterium]